jgi:hypothetical protein
MILYMLRKVWKCQCESIHINAAAKPRDYEEKWDAESEKENNGRVSHSVAHREPALEKPPLAPHACDAASQNSDERM